MVELKIKKILDEEKELDEMRLLILSILLAIFFGIISSESAITDVIMNKNSTDSVKLIGEITKLISKISIFMVPFTLGYILSLSLKYQGNSRINYNIFANFFYLVSIYLYVFIYTFSFTLAFLVIILMKNLINSFIASAILVILIIIFAIIPIFNIYKN